MVKGWITTTLGNLIQNKEVSIQTGPFGTVLSAHEFVDYGIPAISVREIRDGYIEIFSETPCVSNVTFNRLPQFDLMGNDLVLARKGNVERSALIPENGLFFLGSDGIRLRFSDPTLAKIVLHILHNSETRRFLTARAYGTTMAGLNEAIISSIPLHYPESHAEQRRITEALSDMDELISSLEKLIAKKKAVKQGAMQELLTGKRRLPGFSGEWKETNIGALCEIVSGGTPSTTVSDYWNGNIPWCTPTDITLCKSKYLRETANKITDKGLRYSSANLLPTGAILLCSRATIGEARIAARTICTNQGFKSLIAHTGINNEWLYYRVLTLKQNMIEKAIGSTFLEISKSSLSGISIAIPAYDEQSAISQALSDIDTELERLESRLNRTRQIKRGMMQQLLTGKIRV